MINKDNAHITVESLKKELPGLAGGIDELVGKRIRSYDFEDSRDCYMEGIIIEEQDEYFKIKAEKWMINGKPAGNISKYVYLRLDSAGIEIIE